MSRSTGPAQFVTVNGQSANTGDTAPGLCSSFPGVWCNSDGSINAGWDLTLNTKAMAQGAQTLTAQAWFATQASTSVDVTIDQPPAIALTSSPASGVGNGMFTFTINSAAGAKVIEGAIGPLSAGCGFIFYPSAGELTLYCTSQ